MSTRALTAQPLVEDVVSLDVQNTLSECLTFDGSTGFRQRLALSLVTNRSTTWTNLRIRDAAVPGLRPSEACLLELAEVLTENLQVHLGGGHACTKVEIRNPGLLNGTTKPTRIVCPSDRGLGYYLEFLMMVGPFSKFGINDLTLEGITDHPSDISIDSFRVGLLASWRALGGSASADTSSDTVKISSLGALPQIDLKINSRGLLPLGGGSVTLNCGIFNRRHGSLEPQKLVYAGRICRVRGVAFTCHMNPMFATRTLEAAREVLNHLLADVHIYTDIAKGDKAGASPGFGLSLTAETMKDCVYTADGVVDRHCEANLSSNNPIKLIEGNSREIDYVGRLYKGDLLRTADCQEQETLPSLLGHDVALRLLAEVADGGYVSSAFQWLALYYLAFAEDSKRSRIVLGRLTPNTISMLRNLKAFLGVEFDIVSYQEVLEKEIVKSADPSSKNPSTSIEKLLNTAREENRFILDCRGVGFNNISRPTF